MDWQNLLFNTQGRIGASDFWKGVGVIILGNVLVNILPMIGGLLWLVLVWVGVAVYGKRLHDAGRSAFLHLIPWVANSIIFGIGVMMLGGVVLSAILSDGEVSPVAIIAAGGAGVSLMGFTQLIWLLYTLWVGFADGEAGENAYGPAPVIEASATVSED